MLVVFLFTASHFIYRGGQRRLRLPRWYVFLRFGLFSFLCLGLAAAKLAGLRFDDGWFAMAGCILTAGVLVAPLSVKG
jgi:hypothetical protein